jgi:hypothetical protein
MNFDIVGDIHGQHGKLVDLLKLLGYRDQEGAWRHPERTAVFVGDLIDRGPHQVTSVELVRAMVEAGTARCILGNHEFNAIAWVTEDLDLPGEFLRQHGKPGNRAQHHAFLEEVEGTRRHPQIIAWFKDVALVIGSWGFADFACLLA